jgi:hypothetical protein
MFGKNFDRRAQDILARGFSRTLSYPGFTRRFERG